MLTPSSAGGSVAVVAQLVPLKAQASLSSRPSPLSPPNKTIWPPSVDMPALERPGGESAMLSGIHVEPWKVQVSSSAVNEPARTPPKRTTVPPSVAMPAESRTGGGLLTLTGVQFFPSNVQVSFWSPGLLLSIEL